MGDYARRLSDGQRVIIGTCGAMYYCRWEQANEITDCDFKKEKCAWRIPLPSEDGTDVGEYEYGGLLKDGYIPYDLMLYCDKFSDDMVECFVANAGIAQTTVKELGMLINVKCHHGMKLPQGTEELFAGWNGKRDSLHLCFLQNDDKELLVGIRCAACDKKWTTSFNEIEPYVRSIEMKMRLLKQCSEYWWKHNIEPCPYEVNGTHNGKSLKMVCSVEGIYDVLLDNRGVCEESSFEANEKMFMNMLTPK